MDPGAHVVITADSTMQQLQIGTHCQTSPSFQLGWLAVLYTPSWIWWRDVIKFLCTQMTSLRQLLLHHLASLNFWRCPSAWEMLPTLSRDWWTQSVEIFLSHSSIWMIYWLPAQISIPTCIICVLFLKGCRRLVWLWTWISVSLVSQKQPYLGTMFLLMVSTPSCWSHPQSPHQRTLRRFRDSSDWFFTGSLSMGQSSFSIILPIVRRDGFCFCKGQECTHPTTNSHSSWSNCTYFSSKWRLRNPNRRCSPAVAPWFLGTSIILLSKALCHGAEIQHIW